MSPVVNVNLNEAIKFEAVPEGDYLLKVDDVDYPVDTSSGGEMMNIEFSVVEPPKMGDEEVADRKLWGRFNTRIVKEKVYDEKATYMAWGFLDTFIELLDIKKNDGGGFNTDDMINKTVWCHVTQYEYQGQTRNECQKFFQAGAATPAASGQSR